MNPSFFIGVDIGGTNTDAVLVDQNDQILCTVKTATTEDIGWGFMTALETLLARSRVQKEQIRGVFLGTTHATNAILQQRDLFRVGVIRIAGQRPGSLPVAYTWPKSLKSAVIAGSETIDGGLECHGGPLTPLCLREARLAIQKLLREGAESIAIVGVFSPLSGQQENEVGTLVRAIAGELFPLSLSHAIGGIGFLERENSTLLNATLGKVMQRGFLSLESACLTLGLSCPLMVTQNDGSLITLQKAIDYPVLTIAAGPTNSFIGGTRLAGFSDAIVVDIGGTSTDVGLVRSGFPVRSLNKTEIGGVLLNFPMPDVLSIGLGGGSLIQLDPNKPKIGPESVGKFLTTQAFSFGGTSLTLTDAAVAMQSIKIEEADPRRIPITPQQGVAIFAEAKTQIEALIQKVRGEYKDLPVVFVGGGSALLPFLPKHSLIPSFNVANAYGAALAEISGTVDTVVSLQNRQAVVESLCEEAKHKAILQGANPTTLRLVEQQIIPYSYVPNQMARVIVRYCGKRHQGDPVPA